MRRASTQPTPHVKIEREVVTVPEDLAMKTIEDCWNKPSWVAGDYDSDSDMEDVEPDEEDMEPAFDWNRSFVVRMIR